jgi:nucleotide-binding universal stress UspA family protein
VVIREVGHVGPIKRMTIKSILCPTDLSAESDEALRYALALTRAYGARLVIFNSTPDSSGATLANGEAKAMFEQSLLPHLGGDDLQSVDWKGVVVRGDDPGQAISDQAMLEKSDLIVMRSRRRPHRAALLGSTAEAVSRMAPCAVMVTHADEREWIEPGTREVALKRVLVAYDFSDHAELALNYALSLAQEYQSELHLLNVLPRFTLDESEIAWYPLGNEGPYHKAARRLQKAIPTEAHLWCSIKHAVSEGQPYREILNYAERNQIDLICIGAHGAGFGLLTLFGSNVDRVLRQAPCPVLVARPRRYSQAPVATQTKRTSSAQRSSEELSLGPGLGNLTERV